MLRLYGTFYTLAAMTLDAELGRSGPVTVLKRVLCRIAQAEGDEETRGVVLQGRQHHGPMFLILL